MTGTSLDGLDCALVEITNHGLAMRARLIDFSERSLAELSPRLRALAEQSPLAAGEIARLALDFSRFHADAIESLLRGRRADLIALHGQTVFHAPPASWQMVNPWPIAERMHAPVVFDLRGADLALGGQGAPITPLADWILFRADQPRAVINLGGFCNITLLPTFRESIDAIRGMDVCACNHVLNLAAQRVLNQAFDQDGAAAMQGTRHPAAAQQLAAILLRQSQLRRSLGTGDESARWVSDWCDQLRPNDLLASACDGVAHAIAATIPTGHEPIVAGGGAKNRAVTQALSRYLARNVFTTADHRVPIHAREAVCMAVLGALAQDRVPITLPHVTGRRDSPLISGAWIQP